MPSLMSSLGMMSCFFWMCCVSSTGEECIRIRTLHANTCRDKVQGESFFFFFYTCWLIGICMRIQNIDGFGNPFVVWIPSELWNLECASSNRKPYSCHFSAWRSLQEHNLILLVCWWLWDLAAEAGIEPKLIATFFLKRFKTWPTLSFLQCETAQLWIK